MAKRVNEDQPEWSQKTKRPKIRQLSEEMIDEMISEEHSIAQNYIEIDALVCTLPDGIGRVRCSYKVLNLLNTQCRNVFKLYVLKTETEHLIQYEPSYDNEPSYDSERSYDYEAVSMYCFECNDFYQCNQSEWNGKRICRRNLQGSKKTHR